MSNEIQVSKHLLVAAGAFILILGIAIYVFSGIGKSPQQESTQVQNQPNVPAPAAQPNAPIPTTGATSSIQDIYIKAKADGTYDKNQIAVSKGVPVRLHFTADLNAGCGRQLVVYGLNVRAISQRGEEQVVEFTPSNPGTYEYNCGMRMWSPGRLIVQ